MRQAILIIQFILVGTFNVHGQSTRFNTEITFGDRAISYQHFVAYQLSEKWSINNVTLFDTEYENDDNNVFFIRNMVSRSVGKSFKTNVAFGVKNPGSFVTATAQYSLNTPQFTGTYVLGSTYQNGFTLEQSLSFQYTMPITKTTDFYMSLFTVFNTNLKYLERGIQQIRIGIKKENIQLGLALNFDQFKKAQKTLENFGIACKYNF